MFICMDLNVNSMSAHTCMRPEYVFSIVQLKLSFVRPCPEEVGVDQQSTPGSSQGNNF